MSRCLGLLIVILVFSQGEITRAELMLTVTSSSTSYTVGEVGNVDVHVHSNNSPNELLDAYLFDLTLSGGSGVTFAIPQPQAYLDDVNYVFAGRSANIAFGLSATSFSNAGATLTAADVSYDFTPATTGNPLPRIIPDSTTPLLIGRFSFNVTGAGNYSLTIDPTSSFSDVGFNTFRYSSTRASFTAVPEPGSWTLLTAGISLSGLFHRRRSRAPMRRSIRSRS